MGRRMVMADARSERHLLFESSPQLACRVSPSPMNGVPVLSAGQRSDL